MDAKYIVVNNAGGRYYTCNACGNTFYKGEEDWKNCPVCKSKITGMILQGKKTKGFCV